MEIDTICVCGAGTMGSGIAQVSASAGFNTILYELNPGVLQNAKNAISDSLNALIAKNKISRLQAGQTLDRIKFTDQLYSCTADLVIEAIIEDIVAKVALFRELAALNSVKTLFASNTSSLSITQIAKSVAVASNVVGMHFFNPAQLMKLVEVVRGRETSEATVQVIVSVATQMGKVPVVCKDSPGFIVNRVARPYYLESLRFVETGIVPVATIDKLLESTGFRMGPFRLMDLIGNDVNFAVSKSVYEQLEKPGRLKPSPLQEQMVARRHLGRKTGRGYYDYSTRDDR